MSLVELVAALLVVALLASLVLFVAGRRAGRADGASGGTGATGASRVAAALRVAGVIATTVSVAVVAWWAWQEDTGAFVLVLAGVPMAAALLVLGFTLAGRPSGVVTWVAALVMLAWSLLTGLGAGLFFLGPAVLMVVAAVASTWSSAASRPAGGR